MKVSEVMSKSVVRVASNAPIQTVAQKMRDENIGMVPVEENNRLVGVVTDRDIAIQAVAQGNIERPVKDVMSEQPITIQPDTETNQAIQMMLQHSIRRLPVVQDSQIVGVISFEDLVETGDDQAILSALRHLHHETKHG